MASTSSDRCKPPLAPTEIVCLTLSAPAAYMYVQGDVGDKFYMITEGMVDVVEERTNEAGGHTHEVLVRSAALIIATIQFLTRFAMQ